MLWLCRTLTEVLSHLFPHPQTTQLACPELTYDEMVIAIKQLKNNMLGVCSIILKTVKNGSDDLIIA